MKNVRWQVGSVVVACAPQLFQRKKLENLSLCFCFYSSDFQASFYAFLRVISSLLAFEFVRIWNAFNNSFLNDFATTMLLTYVCLWYLILNTLRITVLPASKEILWPNAVTQI